VCSASDKKLDDALIHLGQSLNELRRALTRRLQEINFFAQEKLDQISDVGSDLKGSYTTSARSAYDWALERTEMTTSWVYREQQGDEF
jgi:hypothetical protein